jgi:hypothetical protein
MMGLMVVVLAVVSVSYAAETTAPPFVAAVVVC